jgi:hypothetical protein
MKLQLPFSCLQQQQQALAFGYARRGGKSPAQLPGRCCMLLTTGHFPAGSRLNLTYTMLMLNGWWRVLYMPGYACVYRSAVDCLMTICTDGCDFYDIVAMLGSTLRCFFPAKWVLVSNQ